MLRRPLRDLTTPALVVGLLALLIVAGEVPALPTPHPCIGCQQCHNCSGPAHVYLTIAIFGGFEEIKLNGTIQVQGNVTNLTVGVPVSVSYHNTDPAFSFAYWESNVGNFSNPRASSTTYTPASVSEVGTLAVIINDTAQSGGPWAGYIADDENTGISCAGGAFYNIPATTYVGSGYPVQDINSIWVGIGGEEGTQHLWQAGILVSYTGLIGGGGNQLTWQAFAEDPTSLTAPGNTYVGSASTSFPSELIISVCTTGGTDTASVEAYYAATQQGIWWNKTVTSFTPETSTAEWIVEDPVIVSTGNRAPLGAFAPFGAIYPSWTDSGTTYNEFLGPLTYLSLTDTAFGTQYVTPGAITGSFGQFPLTYST